MTKFLLNKYSSIKTYVIIAALIAVAGCQNSTQQPARAKPEQKKESPKPDKTLTQHKTTSEFPFRGKLHVPHEVKFEPKVVYGSVNGRNLTVNIFTPKKTPLTPRPALVSLHGGSWKGGGPSQFHFHSSYLTAKYGFFCMCVDYRLSGEAKFPAALQDAKCAIRWIRAHALELNIDPERIAIVGGSAGGHLSSMVATTAGVPQYEGDGGNPGFPSHVNLAILFNGEFDMWDLVKKESLLGPMKQFMGGTHQEIPEKYDELSSVKRIHKDCPPTLLLHGTKDGCVSHQQSIAFAKRLKEVGVHAEVEIYKDKPHAWFNREPDRTICLKRMEKFLVEQFKLKGDK
ncbi:MAG: alpha/beta hydrolase fold domain-containing protein [Planctomycetota bacterium]|jgi:acetyl esterase/lipase